MRRAVLYSLISTFLELGYELTKIPFVLYTLLLLPYVISIVVNKRAVIGWIYSTSTVVILVFLFLNCCISLLSGDCFSDTLGSAIRFLMFPFLYGIFSRSRNDVFWIALLYCYPLFSVLGKLMAYLLTSKLYGGPIYVVDFDPFLLISYLGKNPLIVGIITFSVLISLKRSSWLLLLVFLSGVLKNSRQFGYLLVIGILVIYVVRDSQIAKTVETRYFYSMAAIEGGGGEGSISKRISEYEAVLSEHKQGINYLLGSGGGAGYRGAFRNNNLNCRGEFYHIHNMWIILYHRYGLIGILIYACILLSILKKYLKQIDIPKFVFLVVLSLFTFTGNLFFGGFWLTIVFLYESKFRSHLYIP